MTAPDGDHAADTFTWDTLIKCGDPRVAEVGALWNPATERRRLVCLLPTTARSTRRAGCGSPLTRATLWAKKTSRADGFYAVGTDGETRGLPKLFFRCPVGAEMCGTCFTPDDRTLFLAVQHPAPTACGTGRRSGANRRSRIPRRDGRISNRACRPGPPWSRCEKGAAGGLHKPRVSP